MSSVYLRSDPLLQILCFEVQTLYLTVIQAPCMFVPLYITGLQTEVKKIQLRQVLEFSILSLTADSEVGREEACQGYSCVSNRCILPVWGLPKPLNLHIYSRSFPFYPIPESDFHSTLPLSYTSEILPTVFLCFLGWSVHSKPAGCILPSVFESLLLRSYPLALALGIFYFCKQKAIHFHYSKVAASRNLEVHTAVKKSGPLSHFCAICLTMQWARLGSYLGWKQTSYLGPLHCIASRLKIQERVVRVL